MVYRSDRSQKDPGNIPCGLQTDLSAADPIRRKRQPEPDREQAGEENRLLFLYNRPDRNASHKKHLYVYPADFNRGKSLGTAIDDVKRANSQSGHENAGFDFLLHKNSFLRNIVLYRSL